MAENTIEAPLRVHVISRDHGWAVVRETSSRAFRVFSEKRKAIEEARSLAGPDSTVVVHDKNGSVESVFPARES